jgi:hypothetical protein
MQRISTSSASSPFCFYLQHLADRTVLFPESGPVCLLDWESPGFYPRVFEYCGLRLNKREDEDLVTYLLKALSPLTNHEEHEMRLVLEASIRDLAFWK